MKWWLTIAIIEIIHNYKAFCYFLDCTFANKNKNINLLLINYGLYIYYCRIGRIYSDDCWNYSLERKALIAFQALMPFVGKVLG